MRKDSEYFEFCGLCFLPNTGVLTVAETGREIPLSETHRRFLLALLEKAGDLVSYEDLRRRVWPHEMSLDRRLQHTIHVTKGKLVGILQGHGVKGEFIEAAPGKGYRLVAPVNSRLVDISEIPQVAAPVQEGLRAQLKGHVTFIGVTSVLYGFLFWIALILEISYRFDLYGSFAVWLGLLMWVLNSLSLSAALAFTYKSLQQRRRNELFIGLTILITGAVGACGLASLCLPDVPITASTLQPQPALAAFVKNALVYFLPLGFFFLLCPFYFVVAAEMKNQASDATPMGIVFIKPRSLLIISFAAILYSLITSFHMIDHLQPGQYHGLFVTMIFMRFLVYFGLAVGSTLWYRTALPN